MNSKYFFNPYNFVSTPKRDFNDEVFGDARPIGHSRIEEETFSGELVVRMVAETPLLIPSSDVEVDKTSHRSKKTRTIRDLDDKSKSVVAIPPSSVKGMVRSAYEMITNSRFGVFAGHDDRLGRGLHPQSPSETLDSSLRPATSFDSFSSAERVFGWATNGNVETAQNQSAFAGHLRFGPVYCLSSDPVEELKDGRILAILSSPKPTMARFYAGILHHNGEVFFDAKTPKMSALYDRKSSLRGRKVYPHHGSFDVSSTNWQSPTKSKVNQSILDWIKPATEFEFTIKFRNLSAAELGALVACIQTDEGQCHRLGGGRPLGFGAVSLKIDFDRSQIATQQSMSKSWEDCEKVETLSTDDLLKIESSFREMVRNESYYQTYLAYLNGYANSDGILVSYPRSSSGTTKPDAILEWFVENERPEKGIPVNGLPLPQIGASQKHALPYLRRPPRPDNRGGNSNRGAQGGRGPRR